jgi:hypothetical protein
MRAGCVASIATADWGEGILTDEEAFVRLQDILLSNAEGGRSDDLDREYKGLRRALLDNEEYSDVTPRIVRLHRDLGSLWPYMKSFDPKWEPRRKHVREEMEPLFARAEEIADRSIEADPPWPGERYDPGSWTGLQSPRQRLAAARAVLPVAQASIERLIEHLSQPSHNGGPPLDETEEAIENLRALHRTLGEILTEVDAGDWGKIETQGLPAEAARYAKRAARLLRDDPLPYAISGLLLAVLSACGLPNIAGYLAGVALTVRKGRGSADSR